MLGPEDELVTFQGLECRLHGAMGPEIFFVGARIALDRIRQVMVAGYDGNSAVMTHADGLAG